MLEVVAEEGEEEIEREGSEVVEKKGMTSTVPDSEKLCPSNRFMSEAVRYRVDEGEEEAE